MNNFKTLQVAKQFLGKKVEIIFDRPLGSKHPKYDYEYLVNYGYIEDVEAPDGEGLDVYYLGVDHPLEKAEGVCIAIAHRKDNDDDKLIVVPDGLELSDVEISEQIYFQEQWFETEIVR